MPGYHDEIRNLFIRGSWLPSTTKNAVSLTGEGNGCAECTVDNSKIDGGYYGIYADAYEIYVKWTRIEYSCVPRQHLPHLSTGELSVPRVKLDPAYPAGDPNFRHTARASVRRVNSTAARDLVKPGHPAARRSCCKAMNNGTTGRNRPRDHHPGL